MCQDNALLDVRGMSAANRTASAANLHCLDTFHFSDISGIM